jgi:hypothetical protein
MSNRNKVFYYLVSCGLLLLPLLAWNALFAQFLPPAYSMSEFWRDIPPLLSATENFSRFAVFALPFAMPLRLTTQAERLALQVFVIGTLVYFGSWLPLIFSPESAWSRSAIGFAAPAYTPALWLLGLARLGSHIYGFSFYRWWMYLAVSMIFLVAHISHTFVVFERVHGRHQVEGRYSTPFVTCIFATYSPGEAA